MLLAIKLVDLCESFVHIKEKKKVIESNLLTEIFNLYLLFLTVKGNMGMQLSAVMDFSYSLTVALFLFDGQIWL